MAPLILGWVVLISASPARAAGEEAASKEPEENPPSWKIEGYLRQEARFRSVGGDSDLDLYTHVVADAARRGPSTVRIRINGRLAADVAGDQQPGDLLYDIWDTFDRNAQFRLYEGFFEARRPWRTALSLRAGRQFLHEGVYLHFDGLRVDWDPGDLWKGLEVSLLGGIPVKFGETSRDESWLAGIVARAPLGAKVRARLEYYHVSEFFEGINDPLTDPLLQPVIEPSRHLDDDYVGFSLWYRLRRDLRAFGRLTLLNGDANELQLRLRWRSGDGRWLLVTEWYQLFGRLHNVTNDLTPFVPMLGSYEPFFRLSLRVVRYLGERWILEAGASRRELEDEADEGTFNHEYNHGYFAVTRAELFDRRLDLTLTADGYRSSSHDDATVSGNAVLRLTSDVTLTGGVDFSFYKYDFFQDTEHERVWTYSVRVRWQLRKQMRVEGIVQVDDDRFDTYTTVVARFTVRW